MPSARLPLNKRGSKRIIRRFFSSLFFKILVVLLLLFLITFLYMFNSNFLNVKNVEISSSGVDCVSSAKLIQVSLIKNQNFFSVSSQQIEDLLKRKYICIKQVKVDSYFLDKVKMTVLPRQPKAIISLVATISAESRNLEATSEANLNFNGLNTKASFIIDDEGMLFREKRVEDNLPVLYTNEDLIVGQSIGGDVVKNILIVFGKVKEFGLVLNGAKIYSQSELILNTEPKVIFNLNKDIQTQLASLQLILEEAKINEDRMEFVDLRFNKPVVKYLPKEQKKKNG